MIPSINFILQLINETKKKDNLFLSFGELMCWMNGIELPPPSKVSLLNCGVFGYGFDAQLTIIQPTSTHHSTLSYSAIPLINSTREKKGCLMREKEAKPTKKSWRQRRRNGNTSWSVGMAFGCAERPPAYNPANKKEKATPFHQINFSIAHSGRRKV